jgi:hypothetical protein
VFSDDVVEASVGDAAPRKPAKRGAPERKPEQPTLL